MRLKGRGGRPPRALSILGYSHFEGQETYVTSGTTCLETQLGARFFGCFGHPPIRSLERRDQHRSRPGAVMTTTGTGPEPLWVPDQHRQAASHLRRYLDRHGFDDYETAWRWSVAAGTAGAFWRSVADEFAVAWHHPPDFDLQRQGDDVYGARWFGGGRLNYAERALSLTAVTPAGRTPPPPPGRRRRHRSIADAPRPRPDLGRADRPGRPDPSRSRGRRRGHR